jgi:hypothetical protein
MDNLTEAIKKVAKDNLLKDGYLVPVFFVLIRDSIIMEPQPINIIDKIYGSDLSSEESKTRAVFCIGAIAKKFGGDRIIMIWDAAMRTVDAGFKYTPDEAPLTYPKSMRTECLIINDIDFLMGEDKTCVVPYKGGDGEPVVFLPEPAGLDSMESRFTQIAMDGYNRI